MFNNLAILCIEKYMLHNIYLGSIINDFVSKSYKKYFSLNLLFFCKCCGLVLLKILLIMFVNGRSVFEFLLYSILGAFFFLLTPGPNYVWIGPGNLGKKI